MTDRRAALFDAIRPHAPGGKLMQDHVSAIDALADAFELPRAAVTTSGASSIPPDYWPMLAKIESGNNPYAKAGSSTASGLYQFIRSTWVGEGGKWGADMSKPFGGLRPTEAEQTARAKTFTAKNVVTLLRAGIPVNKASLYAAHFAGAGTAIRLIGADVDASAEKIAGQAATAANPSILRGKTVADFLSWLHRKTGEWAR